VLIVFVRDGTWAFAIILGQSGVLIFGFASLCEMTYELTCIAGALWCTVTFELSPLNGVMALV